MMFKSFVYVFIIATCFEIRGLLGIKITLQIIPAVVQRGEHATLRCLYELQGAPLYTVKWYRGSYEFYRFAPSDTPQKREFPIPGIHVDQSLSNSTQVVLRKLEFSMAGNYSCEVSADAPSFSTAIMTSYLDIVAPPESGPVIYVDRYNYSPGDVLEANCTASPSRPALNLTVLVNNQVMSGATKICINVTGGFQKSMVMISLPLTQSHFRGGKMVLRCIGQLHPVYLDSATLTLPLKSDPKSERIMSSSGATILPSILLHNLFVLIFIILFIINSALPLEYEEINSFSDYDAFNSENSYEDVHERVMSSLL